MAAKYLEGNMRARTYLAATAAAGLIGSGAFLLPAAASTQQPACSCGIHTLRFVSVTKNSVAFSKTTAAQQDTDVNAKGQVIGFDQLWLSFNPKTGRGWGNFTFDYRDGFIYGSLRLSTSGATGMLTGGTGAYRHITGSLVATTLNKAGTRTAVTIRYRLR
jgi:hypothetical protein